MKKIVLWIGGAVILFGAVYGGYQVIFVDDKDGDQAATESVEPGEHEAGATKTACDIFTDAVAAKVLGSGATQGESPARAGASTDDVSVTNCLYEIDDPDSEGTLTASVLVRGGKTDTGKSSNEFGFDNNKKIDAQGGQTGTSEPISGIGEAAYFSPAFGQVNVLVDKGTYWLIVQADNQEQTEQLASLLTEQL